MGSVVNEQTNLKEQYLWQMKHPINQKHMQGLITSRLLLELKYSSKTCNWYDNCFFHFDKKLSQVIIVIKSMNMFYNKKWKDNAKFFAHKRFISFWEVYNFQPFLANNLLVD